jgi:hypothetical protein
LPSSAIYSFRLFDLRAFRKGLHEALEGLLERLRIEHGGTPG